MEKFAGLLILLGLGVMIRGGWELYARPEDEGGSTILVGLFFFGVGFLLAARLPASTGAAPPATPGDGAGTGIAGSERASEPEPGPESTAWFSVVESVEDTVLDGIASLAGKDPRVSHVGYDSGRYYSVPAGDDLPEWFALRISCRSDERDAVMQALERRISAEMGAEAMRRVSISYY